MSGTDNGLRYGFIKIDTCIDDLYDLFSDLDEDLNGNNGDEYLVEGAKKGGFDCNLNYYISLCPYQKPKNLTECKENFEFLAKEIQGRDSNFYQQYETYTDVIGTKRGEMALCIFDYCYGY